MVALVSYFAVTTAGLGLGAYWRHEDRAPSVTILGSGSRLSLLVVSGEARLLVAAGDDASAFGNALAQARHPTSRRIDVVVIDGDERSRAVAARVRRDYRDATTFVLDGDLSRALADLGLRPDDVIAARAHVALSPSLGVTVYPGSGDREGWRVEIRHGSTLVEVTSGGPSPGITQEASVLVFTSRYDAASLAGSNARAVVLPVGATSIGELRSDTALAGAPDYGVLVGDGEAVRLRFIEGGIELPSDAIALDAEST